MPLRWLLSLIAGAAATAAFLLATDVPLGVPGEWSWNRTDFAGQRRDALLGAAAAAIVIAGYGALLHFGRRSIDRSSRWRTAGWLAALALCGSAVAFALESTTPGEYSAAKHAWVLYDPGSSGYFSEAAHSKQNAGEFLRGYEAKMAEGDVLHIGTHPPGLILLHRGLLALCRASPEISRLLLATQPESVASAFARLERTARLTPRPPSDSDRAALWLAVLLTHFIAAFAVVPLFFVVRQDFGPRAAWSAAAFWPLVPAVAVFLPKSDALFPFIGMLFLWSWRSALRVESGRRKGEGGRQSSVDQLLTINHQPLSHHSPLTTHHSPLTFAPPLSATLAAIAAGLTMFGGMLLSLAMLPVAAFAVLLTVFETIAKEGNAAEANRPLVGRNAAMAAIAIATFVAAVVAFSWRTEANLLRIWEWNYRNHAAFYEQPSFPRTWWKWLPVNFVEFLLSVGWPAALLAGVVVFQAVRVAFRSAKGRSAGGSADDKDARTWRRQSLAPVWAGLLVIGLLWLSGKNMGEAGRLWLFAYPWVLWMAAGFWNDSPETRAVRGAWYVALAVQAVVAIVTVMSVQAFHHTG